MSIKRLPTQIEVSDWLEIYYHPAMHDFEYDNMEDFFYELETQPIEVSYSKVVDFLSLGIDEVRSDKAEGKLSVIVPEDWDLQEMEKLTTAYWKKVSAELRKQTAEREREDEGFPSPKSFDEFFKKS